MRKSVTVSERYSPALVSALVYTVIAGILGTLILLVEEPQLMLTSLGIFWGTAVMIICRRPQNPTALDLAVIRWGCLPFVIGCHVAAGFLWHWRGLM